MRQVTEANANVKLGSTFAKNTQLALTAFLAKPSGATISFQVSVPALSFLTEIPGRLGLTTREYL